MVIMETLQCAIPVFDGLLPEPHNQRVLDLLFVVAHWHGLAKLRQHTDLTLVVLEEITVTLGSMLRDFQAYTCSAFPTKELQRERTARNRRDAAKQAASGKKVDSSSQILGPRPAAEGLRAESLQGEGSKSRETDIEGTIEKEGSRSRDTEIEGGMEKQGSKSGETEIEEGIENVKNKGKGRRKGEIITDISTPKEPASSGRKSKMFNLNTYKHHSLGDYLETIRQRGTTDSFSTESVRNITVLSVF